MIIDEYKIGNTKIKIADDCKLKEEEKEIQIQMFNKAGLKILQNSM